VRMGDVGKPVPPVEPDAQALVEQGRMMGVAEERARYRRLSLPAEVWERT
jgi:hypothetical protein